MAKFNKKTGTGTYGHNSHYGELVPEGTFTETAHTVEKQKIAHKKGIHSAQRLLEVAYYLQ